MGDRSSIARKAALPKQQPQEQLFDTHPEVSLDFEIVRQAARQKYTRPFLILDTAIVRDKVRRFRAAMPRVRPHYAVKANPDRRVLKVLAQEGAGFEIASTQELDLLMRLGVPGSEVCYSTPIKSRESIAYAAAKGVEWFVVDSVDELRRVHETRADAKLYVRIATPNIRADWPLSGTLGAAARRAQGRRQALLPHSHADPRRRLAAVRQVRRGRGRCPRDRRGGREARRRPCRRDLPRGFAMPQPGKLARRAGEGARPLRRHGQGGAQAAPARHRRRLSGAPRQAHSIDRGDRRGGGRGAQGLSGRRPGDRRTGSIPRFRCRLFRVPGAGNGDARWQALDALGRGPLRRGDRVERRPEIPDSHRPLRPGRPLDGRRTALRLGRRREARRAATLRPAGG